MKCSRHVLFSALCFDELLLKMNPTDFDHLTFSSSLTSSLASSYLEYKYNIFILVALFDFPNVFREMMTGL